MSAESIVSIEVSGVISKPYGLLIGLPSTETVRTRKAGYGASSWSMFQRLPAEWRISVGITAVDERPSSNITIATSKARGWDLRWGTGDWIINSLPFWD